MLSEAGAGLTLWAVLMAAAPVFDYDRKAPLDLQVRSVEKRAGAVVRDVSFRSAAGGRTAAYLVKPKGGGGHAPCDR
jgi:hypothetical protein